MPLSDDSHAPRTGRSLRQTAPLPVVLDTGRHRRIHMEDIAEPAHERISRREMLLRWGGSLAAGAVGLGILSQTAPGRTALHSLTTSFAGNQAPTPRATPSATGFPFGYFHAFFEVNSPDEVAQAAALGINYTITYGVNSWASADPTSPIGKALLQYNMKTFLNIEYPYLRCANGVGQLNNVDAVRDLIGRFHTSPLVAGYWIKDDDCGDVSVAVLGLRNLIRSIDDNPQHWIMPGYGDAGSVNRNYYHGMADLLGFYPYPAYSRGPAREVPDMLKIVRTRTPAGATPPPFIGIYQCFATPSAGRPVPSIDNIVSQAQAYVENGAAGIAGFGWEAPNESDVVSTNATLRQAVGAVTKWLSDHGYGGR